jgi:FtsP/CotA-like multicopper oxidase with cupredoxin domain
MTNDAHHEHDHGHAHAHGHGGHGAMKHEPTAETLAAYRQAYDSAQPTAGGHLISVHLEAREIEWEFVPGIRTRAWGYNGTVPGPTIEGRVGDVVEVHLANSLPEPTIVHWHGMRLAAPMDGTENVQHPVAPGETFTYRFPLRDAGTFWYHPHMNETVQLERGLYGALIVRGDSEPVLDAERVLVFDDLTLDAEGQIAPGGDWVEQHDGRQGSTVIANGMSAPDLQMRAGQIERWRILNAASARYIRLSIGGRPFSILGTDGGLVTTPVTTSELLLAPADRVDIAVGPFSEGENIRVESLPYDRGTIAPPDTVLLATLRIGSPASSRAVIPEHLRVIEPLVTGAIAPTREVQLGWKVSAEQGVEFTINNESHHRADPVKLGELQVWELVNHSPVDHPFHLHGYFFQVVEVNGEAPDFLSWEDTVNVPAQGRVRIAWMPDERPGEWMYHCHILEHHAGGMMAHFEVVP